MTETSISNLELPLARAAPAGVLWIFGLAALLAGCGEPPAGDPETEIRMLVDTAETAAQDGDFDTLAELVARDYADRAGRDRRELLLMTRGMLLRYARLELVVRVDEVQVLSPQLARIRLAVIAAGASSAGLSADTFPLALSLRNEGAGWQVTRAEWGRQLDDGI
ncbi:hypothetical protein [Wenzhouxiangella sp. XN24]|uniref:hypothetical protein n=1 Tax=Wenzhouxiangella sp. XN24 TaxID=2713569 RepID=UPI0013EAC1D8|nr:hypothetical protein [Wenzhouxiangella sp. XN24]NGX17633.1 hypothetical protein [Wenzhouxiangella sp. XN24]